MGLKILHSADWHLDSPFLGFSEQQRQFLKEQQRKIPGKVAELCRKEDCDLVLLAGDLFDGEAKKETLDLLKRELENCGVPVLIAPGYHDYCGDGSPWREESWPENVFLFTGGLESVTIQGLLCRIYGAAFQSMDCPSLLEGFQAQGDEKYCIAVLHGDPLQRNSPYNPITKLRYAILPWIIWLWAMSIKPAHSAAEKPSAPGRAVPWDVAGTKPVRRASAS